MLWALFDVGTMGQTGSATPEPETEVTGQTGDIEKGQEEPHKSKTSKERKSSKQSKRSPSKKQRTEPPRIEQPFDLDAFLMAAKNGDNEKLTFYMSCDESDINASNKRGNTALHIACIHGQLDSIKLLIQNGANVNHQSKHGYTALYNAVMENHPTVVTELLACGADRSLAPEVRGRRCTPLEIAELQGFDHIIRILKQDE